MAGRTADSSEDRWRTNTGSRTGACSSADGDSSIDAYWSSSITFNTASGDRGHAGRDA
jgi:hypothetical protein